MSTDRKWRGPPGSPEACAPLREQDDEKEVAKETERQQWEKWEEKQVVWCPESNEEEFRGKVGGQLC